VNQQPSSQILKKWQQEVRDNPRLRFGLLIASAMIGTMIAMEASDGADRAAKAYADAIAELDRAKIVATEPGWPEAAEAAESLAARAESELRDASSRGVAEAELQAELSRLASPHMRQLRMGTSKSESTDDILKVTVEFIGATTPVGALSLVRDIEAQPHLLVIERMTFQGDRDANASVSVSGYFRVPSTDSDP